MPFDNSYTSFADLTANEQAGKDYRQIVRDRNSAIVVLAPHGGGIEPGTSEIATAIAGNELSLYSFEGLKRDENDVLHITSTQFDAPHCVALVARAKTVIAVHGCRGHDPIAYVGGRHTALKERLIASIRQAGIQAKNDDSVHAGQFRTNICNRGLSRRGVQLEITHALRNRLFAGLTRPERQETTPMFAALVQAVRAVLLSIPNS